MAAREIDLFGRPESPGAHHQEATQAHQNEPRNGNPPLRDWNPVKEMHSRSQQTCGGGNRHTDKVFPPRSSRIARLGIVADIEARQPRDSTDQEEKTDESSSLLHVQTQLGIDGVGKEMKSPDESQQTGRHAKGDGVSQRIQFLAKLATGIGHPRDAAIQSIKGNGKDDGDRGPIQMGRRIANVHDGLDGLRNGIVPGSDIAHCKE